MRHTLCLLSLLALPALARAHPVPKDNHDRTLAVHLTPTAVVVDYRLELDELRAILDAKEAAFEGVGSRKDLHAAFRRHFAPIRMNNIVATLDGKELDFRCTDQSSEVLDHVRCDYRFVADWKLTPGKRHRFTFREGNDALDTFSFLAVRLSHSPKLTLEDVKAPDAELIARPPDRRKPGDDEKLRTIGATVLDAPSYSGVIRNAMPADFEASRRGAPELSRYAASVKPPVPASARAGKARNEPPTDAADRRHSGWFDAGRLRYLLLDTNAGVALLLALAAVFGAAHALTPGHGKTLVAAYLVGQHGTVWHALILGLATTLAHTGGVILVAIVLWMTNITAEAAAVVLRLVGGLLITALGLWLLMQRLRGAADHVHIGGGHGAPDLTKPGASWWSAVVLGLGGGIVPCFDAIGLLLLAYSEQRLWLGIVSLLAFSAGLAAVLVALGLLVVAGQAGARAMKLESRFERVAKALPIVSAVAIIAIGLIMTFGSAAIAH